MLRHLVFLSAFLAGPALAERVEIDGFEIDRTEVTVRAFADYAERKGLSTAAEREGGGFEWGAGWERRPGWTFRTPYGAPASEAEPAVHLSWDEARDFCAEAGGRLPNREEWTRAAYTEHRAEPEDGFVAGQSYAFPVGDTPEGMISGKERHAAVGRSKAGVNGLYDMGGNVWEWLADRRGDQALTAGGSWWYGPGKTRIEGLQWKPAEFYALYIGFRCVYD